MQSDKAGAGVVARNEKQDEEHLSSSTLMSICRCIRFERRVINLVRFARRAGEAVRELAKVFTRMPNHRRRSCRRADKAKKQNDGRVSATTCQDCETAKVEQ